MTILSQKEIEDNRVRTIKHYNKKRKHMAHREREKRERYEKLDKLMDKKGTRYY